MEEETRDQTDKIKEMGFKHYQIPFVPMSQKDQKYKVGDVVTLNNKTGSAPGHEPPYWIIVDYNPAFGFYTLKYPHGDKPSHGVSIAGFVSADNITPYEHDGNIPEVHKDFIY